MILPWFSHTHHHSEQRSQYKISHMSKAATKLFQCGLYLKHIKNHYWNKCVRNVQKTLFQSIFIPILTVSVIWIQIGTWEWHHSTTVPCFVIQSMNWQFALDYLCASFTLLPKSFLQLKLLKTSRRNIIVLFSNRRRCNQSHSKIYDPPSHASPSVL